MNASPIRHILFDLGGTLMHARRNWLPVLEQADQALTETLRQYDIDLDSRTFRARLHQYYEQRDKDLQETTYHFVLRELLKELGYAEIAESILRSALDALYLITQKNWVLEDDALEMIHGLRSRNYQLGIFSNAGDDKDVQELVEGFGIRPYFDFVLTSAACFYRKPHPRTFEIALAQWSIPPEEAAMVGDSLIADMAGAKSLNMKTIWLTRRAHFSAEQEAGQRIEPDFSLSNLHELLPTLERINLK
ncbi:HAD family hydrolase [Candidatus Villigracilis saccharophilus]|uniref:HAD family hydrolase n=1 Tax=Candidatus Villigracilis saccharophilus TaxID=3140684 RepID=UPI0031369C82|nr:HAD family hydrolase [Anaerolineales bacterium]